MLLQLTRVVTLLSPLINKNTDFLANKRWETLYMVEKLIRRFKSVVISNDTIIRLINESRERDFDVIEYMLQKDVLASLNLETERLLIRRFCESDLDDVFACTSNQDMMVMDGGKVDLTIAEAKHSLEYFINTPGKFAICLKNNYKMIGFLSLVENDDRAVTAFDLGYAIHPDYQRQGYATEAIKRILDFSFDEMNLKLITASHFEGNHISKNILRKFHFVEEGIKRLAYYHPFFEKELTVVVYSLLKEEYRLNEMF